VGGWGGSARGSRSLGVLGVAQEVARAPGEGGTAGGSGPGAEVGEKRGKRESDQVTGQNRHPPFTPSLSSRCQGRFIPPPRRGVGEGEMWEKGRCGKSPSPELSPPHPCGDGCLSAVRIPRVPSPLACQGQMGEQRQCCTPGCRRPLSDLFLVVCPALPAAEAFGVAGRGTAPLELRPARECRGALCAAAGGLGGGEDGQVPPNPRACKEPLFSPPGFSRFLKL